MPERDNGQEIALRSAINEAQRDLNAEPDTPSHILKTVQQQEEKFEKLTRELDKERRSVLHQFEKSRLESETGTFASISETEDSFSFRRSAINESVLESESSVDSKAYNNSHLIDSALDALREHEVMDTGDGMQYSGYGNGPDRSYNDYGSPAVNGHTESPGPKQQVKKTTQVTITRHTVQTRVVNSPDGPDPPSAYDGRDYARPDDYPAHPDDYRGANEAPYPGDHQYDADRPYVQTPSLDGSDRPAYRGDRYDRSYNDTPSDMYAPSAEGSSDRYGAAPRSQGAYDSPQPRYADRYDERPVEPRDVYNNYADPYDDRYPLPAHEDMDQHSPQEGHYNGSYQYDDLHPDDITADTAHEQMAPLGAMERTGSQDTVEYDKYDKGSFGYRQPHHVHRSHDSIPRNSSLGSGTDDPQWRTPDLQEIIDYLSHTNPAIVANAAGYLQHLTYGDDPIKNKTRSLGGIPLLVELLGHPTPDIHRCACGALRNISYGKANEENKVAVKNAGGVPALVRLLRTTRDPDTKELVTGTLWNLSSSEPLKKAIIDDGLAVFVNDIIVPDSGWKRDASESYSDPWSGVFRNTTGCLRNVSSSGLDARRKMRDCAGLVDSLVHVIKSAVATNNVDTKVVENTMCVIRNLSFKICNEANHPDAVPAPPPRATPARNGVATPPKKKPDDSSGCFGGNKKKKMDGSTPSGKPATSTLPRTMTWDPNTPIPERKQAPRGAELLFAHEMVGPYLKLLSECSNHVTLEAATGTIQNISSGEWRWALYVRAQVRKEKGLAVLVELLRLENDKIVSAVARALRNLALDTRNKELIGKYAMRDLVFRLPSSDVSASSAVAAVAAAADSSSSSRQSLSTDTLVAILNALQELINRNAENSKSLRDASGTEKLVSITKSRNKYPPTVIKSAFQVLSTMWSFKDLRPLYKQDGWEEQHFNPGVWTTARASPNKSQTLNTPGSERTAGGPPPQRSASTPAPTPAGRLEFEASPLPVKTAPPREEGPPPFSYNSYDRRQPELQRTTTPYDTYRSQEPQRVVGRDERSVDDPYMNVRQPAYARDSMSAYSEKAPDGAVEVEPVPPAVDQPGTRESTSQYSDEAASYVPASQERLPASFAVPQTRDSMSAYSDEAPSERSRHEIPMKELNYASIDHGQSNESGGGGRRPPVGGVSVFGRDPPPQRDNVVYAQVSKNRQPSSAVYLDSGGPAGDSWV